MNRANALPRGTSSRAERWLLRKTRPYALHKQNRAGAKLARKFKEAAAA